MKALLFLAMLTPFACYARPREADAERVAPEKSGKLSEVVAEIKSRRIKRQESIPWGTNIPCAFSVEGPRTNIHNGNCTVKLSGPNGQSVHCKTDNLFPKGPRSFISDGKGDCPKGLRIRRRPDEIIEGPWITDIRCNVYQEKVATKNDFTGRCFTDGLCHAPENHLQEGDPPIIHTSTACEDRRPGGQEEVQREEEKNEEKNEENDEKKSSKDKARMI